MSISETRLAVSIFARCSSFTSSFAQKAQVYVATSFCYCFYCCYYHHCITITSTTTMIIISIYYDLLVYTMITIVTVITLITTTTLTDLASWESTGAPLLIIMVVSLGCLRHPQFCVRELWSKLLEGSFIGDYTGDYYRNRGYYQLGESDLPGDCQEEHQLLHELREGFCFLFPVCLGGAASPCGKKELLGL